MRRFDAFLVGEEFDQARAVLGQIQSSKNPFWQFQGRANQALLLLYQGRSKGALALIEQAIGTYGEEDKNSARAHNLAAHVLLETDRPSEALKKAQMAHLAGEGRWQGLEGLFFTALAHARLGRWSEAEITAERLREEAESLPTEREKRRYRQLMGELLLARNETARAIEELEKAQSMLPVLGLLPYMGGAPSRPHLVLPRQGILRSWVRGRGRPVVRAHHRKHYRAYLLAYPLRPQLLLPRENPREPRRDGEGARTLPTLRGLLERRRPRSREGGRGSSKALSQPVQPFSDDSERGFSAEHILGDNVCAEGKGMLGCRS